MKIKIKTRKTRHGNHHKAATAATALRGSSTDCHGVPPTDAATQLSQTGCSRRTSLRDIELAQGELANALNSVELQHMVGWLATQYQRLAAKSEQAQQYSAAIGARTPLRVMLVQPQLITSKRTSWPLNAPEVLALSRTTNTGAKGAFSQVLELRLTTGLKASPLGQEAPLQCAARRSNSEAVANTRLAQLFTQLVF